MSGTDKAKNKAEQLGGIAKEKIGDLTGDNDLKSAGKKEQAKGQLKDAGEKVKDAAKS